VGALGSRIESSATADCERILESWWGQPINTVTAAAFVVGAVFVWWRRRDLPTSLLLAAIGAGSIAFHGPMPAWGEFLHDASIVLTLAWILLVETGRKPFWPVAFAIGLALSAAPVIADPAQALLAVAVIGVILVASRRRPQRLAALGVLAAGALVGTLSRTGGPLCDPESILQGHGFWHLAAAAALTLWAMGMPRAAAIKA
jgi:hypothetical protein